MLFGSRKVKEIDVDKYTGFASLGGNYALKSNVQKLEELEGGVIIYASLDKEIGNYKLCLEKYKVIVEPPSFLERLLGVTLEGKINKAIRKLKAQCHAVIKEDREPSSFNFNSLVPKFQAFIL